MPKQVGITAYGAYVPQSRLARAAIVSANLWANPSQKSQGAGERAFGSWDEDAITMATEAARDALAATPPSSVGGLLFASTTAPFADRLGGAIIAGALGLPADVQALDIGGSARAGASAAIAALAMAEYSGRPVIATAADRRRSKPGSTQELGNGDGAAALVFGVERVIARVLASATITADFVDHFRAAGEPHDYGWEERWVREEGYMKLVPAAARAALQKAGLGASDINKFIAPSPLGKIDLALAKAIGISQEALPDPLLNKLGYTGTAHGLLLLAEVLETASPGENILLVTFGNGCDALLLQVTEEIRNFRPRRGLAGWLARGQSSMDYMRFLSFNGEVSQEWGARAEFGNKYALTMEYRFSRDMLGFIGGRDTETNVVQFPKTPLAVAPGASGAKRAAFEDVRLADFHAKVIACTADWLTYHPSPPFYFGLVQFENGARVQMEFVDVGTGTIEVGAEVEMVFRVKEIDHVRNYRHYFWKAAPVAAIGTELMERVV